MEDTVERRRAVEEMKKFKSEHQFQAYCVMWFHNLYHEHRRMLHANDNNSYNRVEGNQKKALGVMPGVSDLELILDHGRVYFIELKLPGERQSPEQLDFERKCLERGHWYVVIDTLTDFKNLIWNLLGKRGM